MSQTTTLVLLPQTVYSGLIGPSYTVTGNSQPAAAYYLSNQDMQTVNIKLTGVTGNILIEASLSTTPTDSDWFNVFTLEANNMSNTNSNASMSTNVVGNFVHMRAKIADFSSGVVNHVRVSY